MIEQIKPIKRSPALVEFSRDHHYGLLLVWKIRQGLRTNIEAFRISRYVLHFFEEDLVHHFADEENLLFIKMQENDPMRLRAENEHAALYELLMSLKKVPENQAALIEIANALEKHIRFEERELFNRLQSTMSEEELLELLKEVPERPHIDDDKWDDLFWIR